MALTFNKSKEYTVGVELELQLLDKESLALAPKSGQIITALEGLRPYVKPELMMSNIEVNTRPCGDIAEVERDLIGRLDMVHREALMQGATLSMAGSHPFSNWRDQLFTRDDRYFRLLDKLAIVAKRFNIFGLHVHVGVGSGEKCLFIMNSLMYYLPHLLALSSNSPFWNGEDTGLKSYRSKIFDALPTAGLPFYFKGWDDYTSLVDMYIATGTIETIREIWWDVRPHPDFGTLEIRICDMPPTIREVLAIVSLIQALVARLGREYDEGRKLELPESPIIRENKWRACRYGLEGSFIRPDGKGTVTTKDALSELYSFVYEAAEELGSVKYLEVIKEMLKIGDGASRQLQTWKGEGDLKSVVRTLSDNLVNDIKKSVKELEGRE